MRPAVLVAVTLLLLSSIGCSQGRRACSLRGPARVALLFDARPGVVRASQMAFRSDWPAAEAYREAGEQISFKVHFIDLQGRGRPGPGGDFVYRRFETRRVGRAHR